MLDRYSLKLLKMPLEYLATLLRRYRISADQVTVCAFIVGMFAVPALAFEWYALALVLILLNRLGDGVDGCLARQTQQTDRGAYLDIVLDFIFYSAVVFGFALANPEQNAVAAAALIFSFMGTGSSFLAFAILAERRNIHSITYPNKGFYYLTGITEGTETIVFFVAFCLFPQHFAVLAWIFFILCWVTTLSRIIGGAHTLRQL